MNDDILDPTELSPAALETIDRFADSVGDLPQPDFTPVHVAYCTGVIRLLWHIHLDSDVPHETLLRLARAERHRVHSVIDAVGRDHSTKIAKLVHCLLDEPGLGLPVDVRITRKTMIDGILGTQRSPRLLPTFRRLKEARQLVTWVDPVLVDFVRVAAEAVPDLPFDRFLQTLGLYLQRNLQMVGLAGLEDHREELFDVLRQGADAVVRQTHNLSHGLVATVKIIDVEFMRWLSVNPQALDRIAWEAFERITAEILASKGFTVDLKGRTRNASTDVLAIRRDELGIETRYLVECKRYSAENPVGVSIVNGVIGSKVRSQAEHALLVTSSRFTRDVVEMESNLRSLNLHLRDAVAVAEWLREYSPNKEGGLWLPDGWDVDGASGLSDGTA